MYLYRLLSIIGRGLLTASINFLTFLADRQTGKEGAKDLRNLSGKEVLYCITRPVYIEEVRVNMCEQGVYNICDICVRRMTTFGNFFYNQIFSSIDFTAIFVIRL